MTPNINIDKLIHNLLNNGDFPLVPHNKNPDNDLKFSFDFFSNLGADIIIRYLIKDINHVNFEAALNIISHYKGKIRFFDETLTFEEYSKLKPHLNETNLKQYREIFYEEYAMRIINNKSKEIQTDLVEYIYHKDIELFINLAMKLDITDAVNKIYVKNPEKVFDWINSHTQKFNQLVQLNKPDFIFNNLNGKLEINDATLTYFFMICPMDINIMKQLKKSLGLDVIWKYTHNKVSEEFYIDLIETIDDFIFILTQKNVSIKMIEQLLVTIKLEFPHLYDKFDSLMFLKNDFHNK